MPVNKANPTDPTDPTNPVYTEDTKPYHGAVAPGAEGIGLDIDETAFESLTLEGGEAVFELSEDMVNSPSHYTQNGSAHVEPIDIVAGLTMCRGSAVRYLCRAGLKEPAKEFEDLDKASKYIEFEKRRLKGEPISDSLRNFVRNNNFED